MWTRKIVQPTTAEKAIPHKIPEKEEFVAPAAQIKEEKQNNLWKEVTDRVTKLSLEMMKLIQAVPAIEKRLEKEGLKTAYEVNKTGVRDDQAPVVLVECKIRKHWKAIDKATLDGGAGVNIMSERVRKLLELKCKPAPFRLRMADQTVSDPVGLVENIPIKVAGVKFETSFLVLEVGDSYDILLGRPWLRTSGAIHDWGTEELTMKVGTKKITVSTSSTTVPEKVKPEEIYWSKPQELWKKLEASNIVPLATVDLNW